MAKLPRDTIYHYEYDGKENINITITDLIRCKDCKHWRFDHTCHEHTLVSPMMANDFCSRAERRGEEDDL